MDKNKLILVIGALLIYLLSTGMSFAFFSWRMGGVGEIVVAPISETIQPGEGFKIDPALPKTEECPLNGKLYTKPEKAIWEKRSPLGVMIENHTEARPQSGLSHADIVYEAVAEGGITRFLAIFYCNAAENITLAPVRSARTYYLDWVSEYDALYNHVGGAGRCNDPTVDERAKALCQIDQYGIKDLDQFSISFPNCYRNPDRLDHPVATEHQMVCLSDNLYKIAADRGLTNVDEKGVPWDKNFVSWKFKEEAKPEERGDGQKIELYFWKGYKAYDVSWEYDREKNLYQRFNNGQPHTNLETSSQLSAKNVVVQFTREVGPVDEHKHLLYETIGTGKALIFQDGKAIEGTWNKKTRTARTIFNDASGREIKFNPGEIWIEILPAGNQISY